MDKEKELPDGWHYLMHNEVYEDEDELERAMQDAGMANCLSGDRMRRKSILVALKGGGCSKCGYSKTLSALDFHHPDPETKEFNISWATRNFTSKQFEEILIPHVLGATKLLCSNCHREEHHSRKVS